MEPLDLIWSQAWLWPVENPENEFVQFQPKLLVSQCGTLTATLWISPWFTSWRGKTLWYGHPPHLSWKQDNSPEQSHLIDLQLTTDTWERPAETRRTAQLSSTQTADPQYWELNKWFYFKSHKFGMVHWCKCSTIQQNIRHHTTNTRQALKWQWWCLSKIMDILW